jgi:hypothetical protein
MADNYACSETQRTFDNAEAARASAIRFPEIQDACDAGRVPDCTREM